MAATPGAKAVAGAKALVNAALISAAVMIFGPFTEKEIFAGSSPISWKRTFFKFNKRVITSSLTPSIVENSCDTPSILTAVIAAPGSEERIMRRSELPRV